jgi:hypothetical protein
LNVTVTQPAAGGDLRIFPGGAAMPETSAINFGPGQTRANNALVNLGVGGAIAVQNDAPGTVHLIVDVNGYFDLVPVSRLTVRRRQRLLPASQISSLGVMTK